MILRKLVKLGLFGGALTTTALLSGVTTDVDPSSLGPVRFGRAVTTIGQIVFDYKMRPKSKDEVEDNLFHSECHTKAAKKLLKMCQKNGGAFIKVGQHVAALDYLVPPEYTSVLHVLHRHAPRDTIEEISQVIKRELLHEPNEIFASFDPEPLGVASLAQVHKGTLKKTGEMVAIKVQHPLVDAHSKVDIATMEILVKFVAWVFPDFKFMWLAEEMRKNLPLELDFLNEGKNADIVRKKFSCLPWLKIPKIYWDLSTHKVLVMEFCEGGYITDKEYMEKADIKPELVSDKLAILFSQMIFVNGHVHCDPHPGNFLISKENNDVKLVLLDHGLYTTLTNKFRIQYCSLWLSVLNSDVEGIKYWANELGVGELHALLASVLTARTWTAISKGIQKSGVDTDEDTEIRGAVANYFTQIADILNRVPREMILLFKTNDLLRNIETSLGTKNSARSFISMTRACVRALTKDKLENCKGWNCRFWVNLNYYFVIFKINLYQAFAGLADLSGFLYT